MTRRWISPSIYTSIYTHHQWQRWSLYQWLLWTVPDPIRVERLYCKQWAPLRELGRSDHATNS